MWSFLYFSMKFEVKVCVCETGRGEARETRANTQTCFFCCHEGGKLVGKGKWKRKKSRTKKLLGSTK